MVAAGERPRNPRRAVLRAGKGEHPSLAGNGTQQRIKPVLGRGTDLPFAGILAVARSDRHVLPGLAPAGKSQLQRRRRRQHLDLRGFELAEQKAGDAVAERIAGGEDDDRKSIGLCGIDGGLMTARAAEGCTGELVRVDSAILETFLAQDYTPVVAAVAQGADGGETVYSVSANLTAARLAVALNVSPASQRRAISSRIRRKA